MKKLKEGQYFGDHYQKSNFDGVTITDTEYTHDYVDWHFHENPYFTFLLKGNVIEENKKETYNLSPGSLLFHNWHDSHRNIKPPGFTRGFHLELDQHWLNRFDLSLEQIKGSINVKNPCVKNSMMNIVIESKTDDNYDELSTQFLIFEILGELKHETATKYSMKAPSWGKKLEELVNDGDNTKLTIEGISNEIGIHPVHLSRSFHKYYRTTFGEYCRNIKLDRAISLILSKKLTHSEVAHACHFYDQSHFISSFKRRFKITPRQFMKAVG